MTQNQLLQSLALGAMLLGAIIMGAAAHVGFDDLPLAFTLAIGCLLMLLGSLQGTVAGLCLATAGAGLLGGALAQLGAAVPVWLFVVGLVLTPAGLTWRILRPSY